MRILFTLILALLSAPLLPAACPEILAGVTLGTPTFSGWDEVSGLAASRRSPGVLWAHSDSGNSPALYAIDEDGTLLAAYTLDGAVNVDWEDLAIGPGPVPGVDYLYVGDTGNNNLLRASLTIYRVPEPVVALGQTPVTTTLSGVDALQVMYPLFLVTNYDCETLWVDPVSADLYLVTKDTTGNRDGGVSAVFAFPAPHGTGPPVTMTQVASIALGTLLPNLAVGGDLAVDGSGALLKTYDKVLYWPRAGGQSWADALLGQPCVLPYIFEVQGEALAFDATATGYYTASEQAFLGTPRPLRYYAKSNLTITGTSAQDVHVVTGEEVVLSVVAAGEPGLAYQWFRGTPAKVGSPIPDADGPVFTIAAAQVSDSGDYYCEVSDSNESVASPVFHLVVDGALPVSSCTWLTGLAFIAAAMLSMRQRRHAA